MTPPEGMQNGDQIVEQFAMAGPSHHEGTLTQGQAYEQGLGRQLQHQEAKYKSGPSPALQHPYVRDFSEVPSHIVANSRQPQAEVHHQSGRYELLAINPLVWNPHSQPIQHDGPEKADITVDKNGQTTRDLELGTAEHESTERPVHRVPLNTPQGVPRRTKNTVAPGLPQATTYSQPSTESE
ncbi:hypothetical protein MMC11_005017 [Xylographa trunciseda]|nr:hypothetical protein [Xylographa trunciseda]